MRHKQISCKGVGAGALVERPVSLLPSLTIDVCVPHSPVRRQGAATGHLTLPTVTVGFAISVGPSGVKNVL